MDIRDIRRLYSITSVLGVDKRVIVCPLPMHVHSENTPSFSVFFKDGTEYFKCHGNCQRMGDVIDLVGYLNINGYDDKNVEHIRMAISFLTGEHEISIAKPEKKKRIDPLKHLEYLPISEDAVSYLTNRGFVAKTIEMFKLGSTDGAVSIPYFEDGYLAGIKFRSMLPFSRLRYWSEKGSRSGIMNYDQVLMSTDPILLLKAEIPAMLAVQHGFNACGMTGGETSSLESFKHVFAFSERVIYITDNDANERTKKVVHRYANKNAKTIGATVKYPPDKYKDWDDWLLDDPQNCLEVTRSWMEGS